MQLQRQRAFLVLRERVLALKLEESEAAAAAVERDLQERVAVTPRSPCGEDDRKRKIE